MEITGIFDMHCHLVPHVDDGSRSLSMTMEMLESEYRQGVRGMIVTPHFRADMFETPRDEVQRQFERMRAAAGERYPDLNLYLGCEYHADLDMGESVDADPRYRMNGSRYVLVEFSETDPARYIRDVCRAVLGNGYAPIVAHAERYDALVQKPELIDDLHDFGCYIQVNANSIVGEDGFMMKRFCGKLLKNDQIDFIGSDAHNVKTRISRIGKCAAMIARKYGRNVMRELMIENPLCVVHDERI